MKRRLLLLLFAFFTAFGLIAGCNGTADGPSEPTAIDGVGEPDWVDDAVVYEMFIPDFSDEGTFRGAIDRFDELKAMGVTTIWLMPIHPVGEKRAKTDIGALGSPYAVRDYKAVNPEYGGADQFRAFVDSAHANDMHVIIDWVANHTAWDHPWVENHPEYYTKGPIDGRFTYPLLDGDTTDWTDVVDLNYDNPEMRGKMIDAMQYWVEEYNVDGFRCDVAHQVPLSFWENAIDSLETEKEVFMLAEAAEPEMHSVGFDLTYAWPFYGALKRVWEENEPTHRLLTQVDTTLANIPGAGRRLRFTTNHDETMWDATPVQLFGGLDGSQAAFVLATTLPGTPLVYNGQELGTRDTVSFFAAQPYDWTQAETLVPFYSNYLNVWRSSPALRTGSFESLTPNAEDVVLIERSSSEETLLVAVNVRDTTTTLDIPDAYNNQTLVGTLSDAPPSDPLELGPYQYRILRVVQ